MFSAQNREKNLCQVKAQLNSFPTNNEKITAIFFPSSVRMSHIDPFRKRAKTEEETRSSGAVARAWEPREKENKN